jgi:NAD(P)-dependent dehydrogenase (short-subunit alcohol dehydrogenase family)
MGRLRGKVSIVTGAARGIGRATATLFARGGSSVVIADLLDEGREVADAINRTIGHEAVIFVKTDISREDDVRKMVDAALERFGKIDVLVNNAGIGHFKDIIETSADEWNRVININLRGAFLCCKYVVPHMIRAGGGSIVNVSSIVGVRGGERCVAYAASKAGLIGLTKALAMDLMRYNIRVNAVAPRAIETQMMYEYKGEELAERLKRYLFGRLGKPEEVANAILFLASDEASYISGEVLVVGGYF